MIKLDIVNMVLGALGVEPLVSYDEDSVKAGYCRQYYEHDLRELLQWHNWNFAIKRVHIAPLVNENHSIYKYVYVKPSDLLKIIDLVSEGGNHYEYLSENNRIYSNANDVYLVYVFYNTDPNTYSPLFVEALKWKLVADLAVRLTNDKSLMIYAQKMYDEFVKKAKAVDAQQNGQDQSVFNSKWMRARYSGVF